jgi:hypothetical protein
MSAVKGQDDSLVMNCKGVEGMGFDLISLLSSIFLQGARKTKKNLRISEIIAEA